MREIKFRAWHNQDGRMVESARGVYTALKDVLNVSVGSGFSDCDTSAKPERYTFIQYTGLKDKNGKEIYYDCSIFTFKYLDNENIRHKMVGTITFNIEEQRSEVNIYGNSDFFCLYYHPERMSEFEVEGDIYKNPELLGE